MLPVRDAILPRKPCKYITAGQRCPFGDRCWYQHSLGPSNVNGPLLNPEVLTGGLSCVSGTNKSTGAPLLDFASFPMLKNSTGASNAALLVPSAPSDSTSTVDKRRTVKQQPSGGPPELTLEAFFKRANSLQPRKAEVRPTPRHSGEELKEVELQQMKTRFPGEQCQLVQKSRDKDVYRLKLSPLDPEWKFSFKTVDLLVAFPADYPATRFSVDIPGDQPLPPPAVSCVKSAICEYLADYDLREGGCGLLLRPFLRWLDNSICSIVAAEVEQVCEPSDDITDDTVQPSDDTLQPSDDTLQPSDDTLQPSDDTLPSCMNNSLSQSSTDVTSPAKRGTEIRFQELKLSTTIGTVIFERVKLMVTCERCKERLTTALLRAAVPSCTKCTRCQTAYTAMYHPAILHATNATCGFLDLEGCIAYDLVLQDSIATITCLECGKGVTTSSISFGEQRDLWCQRCHAKLSLVSNQCQLVQHQPGIVPAAAVVPQATSKKHTMKGPTVQPGKPLPQFGTCMHYKKSCRWLRFPCCGKAYPCDVCHDTSEDHPMERAKRMLCGYCAIEQPYTTDKPCAKCGLDLTNVKSSGFWEGGSGCRSRVKMNRNDRHKYRDTMKTASKKQERVGQAK